MCDCVGVCVWGGGGMNVHVLCVCVWGGHERACVVCVWGGGRPECVC